MATTATHPGHVVRAAEIAMDCLRDAAPCAEVSVQLFPPTTAWGEMAKATFTFTAPGENPIQCESSFSTEESWWPDEGEFQGRCFWYDCRKAFCKSSAWKAAKEGGPLPKILRPR